MKDSWFSRIKGLFNARDRSFSGTGRDLEDLTACDNPDILAEAMDIQPIYQAVREQPMRAVDPKILPSILASIQARPVQPAWQGIKSGWLHLAAGLFSMAVLLLFWAFLKPGIVLRWTVEQGSPDAFRVYRAAGNTETYQMIAEVPATDAARDYTYIDAELLPWQAYTYAVEGIHQGQGMVLSQSVLGDPAQTLPMLFAMLVSSLIFGYSLAIIFQNTISRSIGWGFKSMHPT